MISSPQSCWEAINGAGLPISSCHKAEPDCEAELGPMLAGMGQPRAGHAGCRRPMQPVTCWSRRIHAPGTSADKELAYVCSVTREFCASSLGGARANPSAAFEVVSVRSVAIRVTRSLAPVPASTDDEAVRNPRAS